MYAVFETGGVQFSVKEGDRIRAPRLEVQTKDKIVLDKVLFIGGEEYKVGSPYIRGAKIEAEVVGSGKGEKIIVFKKKKRVKYRRTTGHRKHYTELKIGKVIVP
jgi:large subunit ribosomal protein L21